MKTCKGTCLLSLSLLLAAIVDSAEPISAQIVFKTLWTFGGSGIQPDGENPGANLVIATDGALYGTTRNGGASGQGTVFKIRTNGSGYSILKSFAGANGDGAVPMACLVQSTNGDLYGTTMWDNQNGGIETGNGTVFKLKLDGSGYQVLWHFSGGFGGSNPYGALLQANDGHLYGTTMNGGSASRGTIFRLNLDGTGYSIIKSFGDTNPNDGYHPYAGLIQGSDGMLYGTTSVGGVDGNGTVFRLALDGTGYSILKNFSGGVADGAVPWAGLLQGRDGRLYGTTISGGISGFGTIFGLNPDGTGFVLLKAFTGNDGKYPEAGLIQARNGILYGTTSSGGNPSLLLGAGTVFQMDPKGTGFVSLKVFAQNAGQGFLLESGLIQVADGTLYGTTDDGGQYNTSGTLFGLVPPALLLPPLARGPSIELQVSGCYGHAYTIERSVSMAGPWVPLGTVTITTNSTETFIDSVPLASYGLYRAESL